MKRLLQINSDANSGSTGRIAEQINALARDSGWDTYIAYGRDVYKSQSKLIRVGSKFSVYEHYVEHRIFDNEGLSSRNATILLIEKIKTLKPDLIHLHNIHDHWLNYKILFEYFNSLETPLVWTLHDCWPFTGGCNHFSSVNCEKWKTKCKQCQFKKGVLPFIDRTSMQYNLKRKLFSDNHNLTLVPVSYWLENLASESFFKSNSIHTIHNGIDTNVFKPVKTKSFFTGGKFGFYVLGCASVWDDRKGFNDFLKLSRIVDDDVLIVLVGLNDKQVKNLPNNVLGIKRTESVESLVNLYSSSDIFLNLTYEDNYPTTNLEAISCGTPVITYKTGGSIESITNSTGWIVKQGDIETVNSIIKREKKHQTIDMKQCRNYALMNFNSINCYSKYIDLYDNIIGG